MVSKKPDSVQQAILQLTEEFDITPTYLAASLGVSERALSNWEQSGLELGDHSCRVALRLQRLYEVTQEIKSLRPALTGQEILSVIENGEVRLAKSAWEDLKALPLIEYICAWPEEVGWRANVQQALADYVPVDVESKGDEDE